MRFIFKTRYEQDIVLAKHGGHVFWYSALMLVLVAAPWLFSEYWLAQLTFVLFRHQHAPIRQKCDRPRLLEIFRDGGDLDGSSGTQRRSTRLPGESWLELRHVRRRRLDGCAWLAPDTRLRFLTLTFGGNHLGARGQPG